MEILLKEAIVKVLSSPNVADKKPVFEKYDQNVQGNTVTERSNFAANIMAPFRDFAELDEISSKISVGIATGGNPNLAKISAKKAAQEAVCAAVMKLSCVGATPLAVTDCLNFGNPEKPEQMGEFVDAVNGLSEVCTALNLPIVSGNVSFYNESAGRSIPPSALISVFGKVENPEKICSLEFKNAGDTIFLVGTDGKYNLGGSEFLNVFGKKDSDVADIDFSTFSLVMDKLQAAVQDKLLSSAAPILSGGRICTILKSCFLAKILGAEVNIPAKTSVPHFLFTENLTALVTSSQPEKVKEFFGDYCFEIGKVTSDSCIKINHGDMEIFNEKLSPLKEIWENVLRDIV